MWHHLLVGTTACLSVLAQGGPGAFDEAAAYERSLVSLGDTARLEHVLAKARRGEEIVVAVIGGSITQGASATSEDRRWGNRVAQWWRDTFPQAKVRFVNAGIGATGSDIGAHRAAEQLLKYNPDFIGIEFGVNDGDTDLAAETLEGLVRQALKQPNHPAVLLLFTMNNGGGNAQEHHSPVGRHYGLPMVSYRDALWPEIAAKRLAWEDVGADVVHPNDRGHEYCARFIARALERVLADLPADEKLPPIPPIPAPLHSDTYEFATYLNAATAQPKLEGFVSSHDTFLGPCWRAEKPGSTLELEVEGTSVGVVYYRIKGAMGRARVSVDGGEPTTLEGWFEAGWGGYSACAFVARGLAPGKHTLRVEVLNERHESSTGNAFEVHAVLVAGR